MKNKDYFERYPAEGPPTLRAGQADRKHERRREASGPGWVAATEYDELDRRLIDTFPASDAIARY